MNKANLQGIQNPIQEIEQKLNEYFNINGFKSQSTFNNDYLEDGDYAYLVEGAFDEINVRVTYLDYKPRKKVVRDILALDDRISGVDVVRQLSNNIFREKESELLDMPIYVEREGELVRTTFFDYVNYSAQNIDFTKCNR